MAREVKALRGAIVAKINGGGLERGLAGNISPKSDHVVLT
jgi:hypothetical protein